MTSQPKSYLTREEYLEQERKAEYKSEYHAGEVFALAGARRNHNLIVSTMNRLLGNQLADRECNVYVSDLRVRIPGADAYVYPDVVVCCGEEQFEDEQQDVLLNPVVIVEVLSDSTEAYDRGRKFQIYQQIESLREYILVSQNSHRIEQFVRQGEKDWVYTDHHDSEDKVILASVGCELGLDEVYAKVK